MRFEKSWCYVEEVQKGIFLSHNVYFIEKNLQVHSIQINYIFLLMGTHF